MTLWRIGSHRRLDGAVGLLAPGRWHTQGSRIVYCAPHPATELVEILVDAEIEAGDLPDALQYLEVEAPDTISIETVDVDALCRHWQKDHVASRLAGDQWLHAGSAALLRVPSVMVPATWNVLINARHPESAAIRVVR